MDGYYIVLGSSIYNSASYVIIIQMGDENKTT